MRKNTILTLLLSVLTLNLTTMSPANKAVGQQRNESTSPTEDKEDYSLFTPELKVKDEYTFGEPVTIKVGLINNNLKQKIKAAESEKFRLTLTGKIDDDNPDAVVTKEFNYDGTSDKIDAVAVENGMIWVVRKVEAKSEELENGKATEAKINLEGSPLVRKFAPGEYKLTLEFKEKEPIEKKFKVVVDEDKTIPLLTEMLKSNNGDEIWATSYLVQINKNKFIQILEQLGGSEDEKLRAFAGETLKKVMNGYYIAFERDSNRLLRKIVTQ